ncbi:uncharacterized protein LOC112594842 [Melanaphis sacchari]|uniref:uncharacterized protein LOC112594842 n=1 Tax=Melanaphis sacchari TaxID=742174 RepID=UPI000DC142A5|nr:uncharacterized protein LOC112594842 [Melanaphis sacchari]XP_025195638.1 uncharacterized protein LOC112594842 [Melanaphis sacchari]
MMDDSTEENFLNDFYDADLIKKLDDVKQIINDSNYEGSKESSVHKLLQDCIEILKTEKNSMECIEKGSCISNSIVNNLLAYEKNIIALFKHCSESNLIYGNLIMNVKQLLTELFKKASEIQLLFFGILEKVKFDLSLKEDLNLLLKVLQYIWYGAEAVYNASNKIMASHWKAYITMLKKYAAELKDCIINDEPIDFLCSEIKKTILSHKFYDEASLKLLTYMMSVLVKLCSYGRVSKSHNILLEFILFLNSYWLSDTQNAVAVKDRLSQFVDQLVLLSDDIFVETFQSSCQDIINNNSSNQKMSAMYIAMLLIKRLTKAPCDQQARQIICVVFNLIKSTDSIMCCYNINIYEDLLINVASIILISDYSLFENVENILIQNILNTKYWPALFSSDLWIIIMRYLSPDLCILQFSKLAKLFEALIVFPCFAQCPQHIYLEMLLKRHFSLITNKSQLVNCCPQLKLQSLKSAVGILHVSTLSKYNQLSEMIKIIRILPEQTNYEHLNEEIVYLWNCIKDEYPSEYLCALVEVSIGSEKLLKRIIPKTIKILSSCAYDDTTEMKRCRLRLIRSILLHMPRFQEKLIMDIFLQYLFDHHPLVQQWTIETIVYFSSITENQNHLISMLFKQPEVRTIIKDYLEMKINHSYNYDDLIQYFEQLSLNGEFQHICTFDGKLGKVLDTLKINIDCLNDIVSKTQITADELERLKEYTSLLNNICEAMKFNIEDF